MKTRINYRLPESPLGIVGDGTQIRQVVMNLITNAADALGDGGGEITIDASAKPLTSDDLALFQLGNDVEPGDFAVLSVKDSGVGMDEATVRRIFDPFFTTKKKGRGLGLAAVLGIIKSHSGAVKVSSTEGKGTRFTVALPLATIDEDSDNSTGSFEALPAGGTVLFVDDDASIRDLAEGLLGHSGYDVILGNDGVEGLDLFRKHADSIDTVILDLVMPNMDGRECFQRIREIDNTVPIIISSGQVSIEEISDLVGANGFLRKPYGADKLLALLSKSARSTAR